MKDYDGTGLFLKSYTDCVDRYDGIKGAQPEQIATLIITSASDPEKWNYHPSLPESVSPRLHKAVDMRCVPYVVTFGGYAPEEVKNAKNNVL